MHLVRTAILVAAAIGWTAYRQAGPNPVVPVPAVVPHQSIAAAAAAMPAADRQALADAYDMISRSVAANPAADPVFRTVGDLRRGHRAAMLCVWRGLLGNQPGQVPGLREAIEQAVAEGIGSEDVVLNPTLQQQSAKVFADIAASLR